MRKFSTYDLAQISLLACLIIVTGMFKIPTGIPGSEFQLSAPIAVAIAAVFGFKRYFLAGIIASLILFLLGIHSILNVEISIIFRLTVGLIIVLLGTSIPVLVVAAIGTMVARLGLAFTLGTPFLPLFVLAIPGMVITAVSVYPITKMLYAINKKVAGDHHVRNV
ncbi:Protein BioX OS=Lysinibacillus sphaericus OX=1421 GN=LS41612_20255 PE=4 SV=1 [Lysinibacillus sphaericus]